MWLRAVREGASIAALALAVGCGSAPTDLGPGERCVRSAQCNAGLACNAGMCTNDLTGFGMGVVPSGDAGMMIADAAIEDAGELDAGPPIDSGEPPIDSGPPPVDAGPPDAGPPDAGPPDAGPPDAGPEMDAGEPDAGDVDSGV